MGFSMLDAFKKGQGNSSASDLQALIASSREERAALSTMLTQIQLQSSKLASAGKALQNVEELVGGANERLEQIVARLDAAESKARVLDEIETRIAALHDGVARAEQDAARLTAPDGALQEHRRAVEQLSARAAEAFASLDALKEEQAAVEQIRAGVRDAAEAAGEVARQTSTLQSNLASIQAASSGMSSELAQLNELSRETRLQTSSASDAVKDVERRLDGLVQVQQQSAQTEERIIALQGLAAEVSAQIRSLDSQKASVERAVAESNRVNEMIRNMEIQVNGLREAAQHATTAQQLIDRVEQTSREVFAQLETGLRARDEFVAEIRKLDEARTSIGEVLQLQAERVAAGGRELDAMDDRVKSITSITRDLELRAARLADARAAVEEQMKAADDQLLRLQSAAKTADDRRRHLASADEHLGIFQGRLAELQSLTAEVERRIQQVANREAAVDAVREQVLTIHQITAQSRADIEFVEAHRDGIAGIRQQVDELLASINQPGAPPPAAPASAQVESSSRLADLVREAQATMETLQAERELAERLQRGMRQARSRNPEPAEKKTPA